MRFIPIDRLKPGMLLAQSIYDDADCVLLGAYVELTKDYIARLVERGFPGVYIEDELSKDIEIQEVISNTLRNEAVRCLRDCNIDQALNVAEKIVEELLNKKSVSFDMVDLRSFDDYTYRHSVNVAVLSTAVGMGMGLSAKELINLCAAAIFHDLGKLEIPEEILNKPGRLTDEEYAVIKRHPVLSYELIKGKWNISSTTKKAVLSHHENEDGSGYPHGLESDQIHLYAKIVHVADVYDALTTKRPYKKPYSPAEAMEYLMGGCGILFDQKIVKAFMKKVPLYPKGSTVLLSTDKAALIVENQKQNNMRPVVRLEDGMQIDLNDWEQLSVTIVGVPGEEALAGDNLLEAEKLRKSNKKHILIVDHEVSNLKVLNGILEDDYRISAVKSGKQALKFIEKTMPDLILIEVDMLELDGIDTVRIMQETYGDKSAPVIFVTALSDKETVSRCREVNAKDYIVKPFKPVYLQERIELALKE